MNKARMEAFSDAVIAIIITIMVLELKVPHGSGRVALNPLIPILSSYILSFVFLGIYWTNHHHLLHTVRHVNGRVLWANLHLLFWLSLIPFVTGWMGENAFAPLPVAMYGVVMLAGGVAYFILTRVLISLHGGESTLAVAVGSDFKGKISVALYALAIPMSFVKSWVACAIYFAVALVWLVPDPRLERAIAGEGREASTR